MRILVADDHDLVRETIAAFLMSQENLYGLEVTIDVKTAGTVTDACSG